MADGEDEAAKAFDDLRTEVSLLRRAVERLAAGAYAWVVLTSPNGARRLLATVRARRPKKKPKRR